MPKPVSPWLGLVGSVARNYVQLRTAQISSALRAEKISKQFLVRTSMAKKPQRNGHAFHPIMKKGGAHGKSKKAQRKAAKHAMCQKVQEWLGRSFNWSLCSISVNFTVLYPLGPHP